MTRSFFVLGITFAALALTSLRIRTDRRVPRIGESPAGACANRRSRLRWSTYLEPGVT